MDGSRLYLLGLGSNIDPERNLPRAVELLRKEVAVLAVSRAWESPPAAGAGPCFLNAAVLACGALPPKRLKSDVLRKIEARLGRVRSADKHAPRPIDIDILACDAETLDAELWARAYLAIPAAELLPELLSGQGETLAEVARRLASGASIRLREEVFRYS